MSRKRLLEKAIELNQVIALKAEEYGENPSPVLMEDIHQLLVRQAGIIKTFMKNENADYFAGNEGKGIPLI